jgi:hypothetical protein
MNDNHLLVFIGSKVNTLEEYLLSENGRRTRQRERKMKRRKI